ncbi:MAG: FmdB family zinc ribbon protein [Candidatus Aquicultorales bacterium]
MPSYDFVCRACENEFEIFLTRVVREEDKRCPKCGGTDVASVYRDFFGFGSLGASGGCSSPPNGGFSFG